MQTEVKKTNMTISIADLAKEFELVPGTVYGVLSDLGVEQDGVSFEADDDTLELVKAECLERAGSKDVYLKAGPTPREIAAALGLAQSEIQKALVTKFRVMATLTTALKDDVAQKVVESYGFQYKVAEAPKPRPAQHARPKKVEGAQPRP